MDIFETDFTAFCPRSVSLSPLHNMSNLGGVRQVTDKTIVLVTLGRPRCVFLASTVYVTHLIRTGARTKRIQFVAFVATRVGVVPSTPSGLFKNGVFILSLDQSASHESKTSCQLTSTLCAATSGLPLHRQMRVIPSHMTTAPNFSKDTTRAILS